MGSMRQLFILPVIVVVCALGSASADERRNCHQAKDAQVRIKDCSELIRRDPADAKAYLSRADAYEVSGDLERAIADYTKVVELAPDSPTAYDRRGRAYARNGDYSSAMADVMKVSELTKGAPRPATAKMTTALVPEQERKTSQRPRATMWWCCRRLLPASWLRRLHCQVQASAR
jgi:tetratricopeptide (TPR) repeat protein